MASDPNPAPSREHRLRRVRGDSGRRRLCMTLSVTAERPGRGRQSDNENERCACDDLPQAFSRDGMIRAEVWGNLRMVHDNFES